MTFWSLGVVFEDLSIWRPIFCHCLFSWLLSFILSGGMSLLVPIKWPKNSLLWLRDYNGTHIAKLMIFHFSYFKPIVTEWKEKHLRLGWGFASSQKYWLEIKLYNYLVISTWNIYHGWERLNRTSDGNSPHCCNLS